jgi:hypothetical protein
MAVPGEQLLMMDIDASIKRFCVDWGTAQSSPLEYEDFDAHADENTVPEGDLIGTSGLSLSTSHPFVDVDVMIGVATEGDTNLFRLRELVARLFQRLQPMKTIDVLDFQTGEKKGLLIVQDGVRVLPVGGDSSRPVQFVMVGFKTNCFMAE